MPANDIEIHGSFKINSYNITYYIDNEIYLVKTYLFNEKIIPEEFPIKEEHTFLGWSNIPETMPANDVTITGYFIVNEYQVTYVLDGEIYQTITVSYGSTLVLPEVAEREGYTFSGWSGVPETMPAIDITIPGSFSVNYYTVEYYLDNELFYSEKVAFGSAIPTPEVPPKEDYAFSGWLNVPEVMPAKDVIVIGSYLLPYLTFTALEDDMTVSFDKKATSGTLNYSIDEGNTWTELTDATPSINSGEKIMFKGDLIPSTDYGIGTYSTTKNFDVSGNAMSLLYGDDFIGQNDLTGKNYAFYELFVRCTKLINAKDLILPATILSLSCYNKMFYNCTSLTTAPELPATTLTISCYQYMFYDCTSLTIAPELPATILVNSCYSNMFYNCNSLNYIKMLATNIYESACLDYWVYKVSSTGTFVKSGGVNIPTGVSGIPSGWTVQEI